MVDCNLLLDIVCFVNGAYAIDNYNSKMLVDSPLWGPEDLSIIL